MEHFHTFHEKIQTLASLNETIVNTHFPSGSKEPRRWSSRMATTPACNCHQATGQGLEGAVVDPDDGHERKIERGPPTLRPKLPVEILELVFRYLTKSNLIPLLQSNRALHSVAIRLFYRVLVEERPDACVALVKRLLRRPSLHAHVRVLDINVSSVDVLTANFYRLLQRLLQKLTGLTSLSLDFPKLQSPVWIFEGCSFSLKQLSTSMHCSPTLARFLDTQPGITSLTLRGFQNDAVNSIPFLYMDVSNHSSSSHLFPAERAFDDSFLLEPTSLPRLSTFNAIHTGPAVVAAVTRGRPVTVVSIPLFARSAMASLDALGAASVPLKRMSVISFDPNAPAFIFEEVAKRFPALEALHIVVLLAEFTKELLIGACPHLRKFKHLKYITCVATSPEDASMSEEQEIARRWHRQCPTLQTIILPKGRVWFQTPSRDSGSEWTCFED